MAEGFYKFTEADARGLARMIAAMPPRSREARTALACMCLASTSSTDGTFVVGRRTLATKCEVPEKAVRTFFEWAEEAGFIEVVGTKRSYGGEFTIRRFEWVGLAPKRAHPWPLSQHEGAHRLAPTRPERAHIQSTEYSESALGALSANAESTSAPEEEPEPAPLSREELARLFPKWEDGEGE